MARVGCRQHACAGPRRRWQAAAPLANRPRKLLARRVCMRSRAHQCLQHARLAAALAADDRHLRQRELEVEGDLRGGAGRCRGQEAVKQRRARRGASASARRWAPGAHGGRRWQAASVATQWSGCCHLHARAAARGPGSRLGSAPALADRTWLKMSCSRLMTGMSESPSTSSSMAASGSGPGGPRRGA